MLCISWSSFDLERYIQLDCCKASHSVYLRSIPQKVTVCIDIGCVLSKLGEKTSATRNWSRVFRVTGGNADHYTAAELRCMAVCIILSPTSCVSYCAHPFSKADVLNVWLALFGLARTHLIWSSHELLKAGVASTSAFEEETNKACIWMHQPEIEPGSHRWQRCILPLDHWCFWQRCWGDVIS